MSDPMAEIRVTFFQECEEQLAELETGLIAMENGTAEPETVNAVFRAVHSMKGGAGIFALDALVRFAHIFETALDKVRSGTLAATPAVVSVFLRAADLLADLVRAARDGGAADEARITGLAKAFAEISNEASEPGAAESAESGQAGSAASAASDHETAWRIVFTPHAALYAKANEAALLLRELHSLGQLQVQLDTENLPELSLLDPEGAYLSWRIELTSSCTAQDIRDVFEFVEADCNLLIEPLASASEEPQGFAPGTVISGENGFKFEFFAPIEAEVEAEIKTANKTPEPEAVNEKQAANAKLKDAKPEVSKSEQIKSDPPKKKTSQRKAEDGKEYKEEYNKENIKTVKIDAEKSSRPAGADKVNLAVKPAPVSNIIDANAPSAGKNPPHSVASPVQPVAAKPEPASVMGASIRVDLDRVDRMIDLVGELVINEAMLSQRVLEAGLARASGVAVALEELEHLTREIQDSVMAIRAQPVRSVFQRMPRLVREVASMTGKQVRLVMEGEATEVDKTVIERIADPLTHMIRNAVDHGLESPETRLAAGKPAEGMVRLTALHRSGRIVLEVADDGAGINRARVRQKAVENGLIPPDLQLSDEEIDNLIFLPGFSTASAVSDISGRGVGMDVVRQSIQSLGGRISISSNPGFGSVFTLSLPLTLAVLDGMVVSAHGHSLIIPLGAIVETLKPRAQDVFPLDRNLNLLALRGGYVPLLDVAFSLGYSVNHADPAQSVALLVEGEGGARAVLLVDEIHGQRQVVIKSLEANYRAVPGIAAATVMGDGRVALIVDVDAVVLSAGPEANAGQAEARMAEMTGKAA